MARNEKLGREINQNRSMSPCLACACKNPPRTFIVIFNNNHTSSQFKHANKEDMMLSTSCKRRNTINVIDALQTQLKMHFGKVLPKFLFLISDNDDAHDDANKLH